MATCYNCPYFNHRTHGRIYCEGAIIRLPDKQGLTDFAQQFCGSAEGYRSCAVYLRLEAYYEQKYQDEEMSSCATI